MIIDNMIGTVSKWLRFDLKDWYVSSRFKIHFTLRLMIRGDQEDLESLQCDFPLYIQLLHIIYIVSIRPLSYAYINLNY